MKRALLAILLIGSMAVAQEAPRTGSDPDDGGRVVGGEDAPPGSARFQAELFWTVAYTPQQLSDDRNLRDGAPGKQYYDRLDPWELVHSCGGAVIAPGWVLTAAHCVNSPNHPFLTSRRVRLGTQDVTLGGATYAIDRAAIHAGYDKEKKINDIALIHLVADAQTAKVDPARIAPIRILGTAPGDRPVSTDDEVSVTGWGLTKVQGIRLSALARDGTINRGSPVLQMLSPLYVLDPAKCAAVGGYAGRVWPTTLCVGAREAGKDSCSGDSGGPLTRVQGREKVLVGLVSWGLGCGLQGVPGIYTNTADYIGWIARAKQVPPGRVTRVG